MVDACILHVPSCPLRLIGCAQLAMPSFIHILQTCRSPINVVPGDGRLDDSCYCGTPQFHIVRFNPANYDLPQQDAMGGHKKSVQFA